MEFPYVMAFGLLLQEKPEGEGAIIVKILPPQSDLATLGDVLVGSLGLSGALAVAAILAGLLVGGLLFWVRHRSA